MGHESRGITEGFERKCDEFDVLVAVPTLQCAREGEIRAITCGEELLHAKAARVSSCENHGTEGRRLTGQCDRSPLGRARGERNVERVLPRAEEAERGGAKNANAVCTRSGNERFLRGEPLLARVREARTHHDYGFHAALRESFERRDTPIGAKGEDREVHGTGDIGDASEAFKAIDFIGLGVHGEDRTAKATRDEPVNDLGSHLVPATARPHDHDRCRVEQQRHGCGLSSTHTLALRREGGGRRNCAPGKGHGPFLDFSSLKLEARALKNAEHRIVIGEHIRRERFNTHRAGDSRQAFDEDGADSLPMQTIRYDARDVGNTRRCAGQARNPRDGPAPQRHEGDAVTGVNA